MPILIDIVIKDETSSNKYNNIRKSGNKELKFLISQKVEINLSLNLKISLMQNISNY